MEIISKLQRLTAHQATFLKNFLLLFGVSALLTLSGCGGGGGGSSSPANSSPTANAGPDQTVAERTEVQLNGSGTDAEGAVSYRWEQTAGEAVSLSSSTIASPSFTAPNIKANTRLEFRLTVTDGGGLAAADSVAIDVINQPQRLKRLFSDYDNNGIADYVTEYGYDELGRIISSNETYEPDGSDHLTGEEDGFLYDYSYEYNQEGYLEHSVAIIKDTHQVKGWDETSYEYSDEGALKTLNSKFYEYWGELRDEYQYEVQYAQGRMQSVAFYKIEGGAKSLISTYVFEYGANGLPVLLADERGNNISYQWYESGRIASWYRQYSSGYIDGIGIDWEYEENGAPKSSLFRMDLSYEDPYFASRIRAIYLYDEIGRKLSYRHDFFDDGGTELHQTFEWETGVCTPTYGWDIFRAPYFSGDDDPSAPAPRAGYYRVIDCEDNYGVGVADAPPVVNAGRDRQVTEGANITLQGSGTDIEGPVTFFWEQLSGPTVVLSNATDAQPQFLVPQVSENTEIVLQLTVTDSEAQISVDAVTLSIQNSD